MSATTEGPDELVATIYEALDENDPMSVPEVVSLLRDRGEPVESEESVERVLRTLVKQNHVTHDAGVDSEGQLRWRTTTRPDLNPKPNEEEILTRD